MCAENSVDPDYNHKKPADLDLHCFQKIVHCII